MEKSVDDSIKLSCDILTDSFFDRIEEEKREEKNLYMLKLAEKLSDINNVVIKGSFLLYNILENFKREPLDLDFILNELIDDSEEKIKKIDQIILSLDKTITLRKKTSVLRYGFFSYISDIDDSLETIKIECLSKAPIEDMIETLNIRGYKIRAVNFYKQCVDKIMSINYFNSDRYVDSKNRFYNAIYDVDVILKSDCLSSNRNLVCKALKKKITADELLHNKLYGKSLNEVFFSKNEYVFREKILEETKNFVFLKYNVSFSIRNFINDFENVRNEFKTLLGLDENLKKYDYDFVISNENIEICRELFKEAIDDGLNFKKSAPVKYKKVINFNPSTLPIHGTNLDDIVNEVREKIIPFCSNFSNKNFFGFPDAGNALSAVYGSILTAFLNQNLINSSFCSDIGTKIDIEIISWFRSLIGYKINPIEDIYSVGGIVTHGGTISNSVALMLARNKYLHFHSDEIKMYAVVPKGIDHYSIRSTLEWVGLKNSIIEVETDGFKYNLHELKKTVTKYKDNIFCVVAYAGDSRSMSIDNLEEINTIVKKINSNIWLHLDACHGFSLSFSRKYKAKLKGIENFDSITVDPHKIMMVPYTISVLLVKNPNDFKLISSSSDLITKEKFSFGQITPFIGSKPFYSLKLWLAIKNIGILGYEKIIDARIGLALLFKEKLLQDGRFIVLNDVEINSVMFMFKNDKTNSVDELNTLNKKIYKKICEDGLYYVHQFPIVDKLGITGDDNLVYPLRYMNGNPLTKEEDLDEFINYLVEIGANI